MKSSRLITAEDISTLDYCTRTLEYLCNNFDCLAEACYYRSKALDSTGSSEAKEMNRLGGALRVDVALFEEKVGEIKEKLRSMMDMVK